MLKKEVRILGISAPIFPEESKAIPLVGVVYRGNLWLDGVFTCLLRARGSDHVSTIANTIIHSKQYSQIRAVILSRKRLIQGSEIDIADLSHKIKLPTLCIVRTSHVPDLTEQQSKGTPKSPKLDRYTIRIDGAAVKVVSTGLTHALAREIFSVSCVEGHCIPEAVRVADLIAWHLTSPTFIPRTK